MTVLADLGACYRWAHAADARHRRLVEMDNSAVDGAYVMIIESSIYSKTYSRTFHGRDLPSTLAKAGAWARRQIAKDAERRRRSKKDHRANRRAGETHNMTEKKTDTKKTPKKPAAKKAAPKAKAPAKAKKAAPKG